jgi:SAM-dependent methyltransferase
LTDPLADRRALREGAYADASKLAARQAIYRYVERPWPSDGGRVPGAIPLRGDELVVDVGCGNGNDVRDLQAAGFGGAILAFDLSVGMLRTVLPFGVPVVNADAAALPLATGVADVALAMHMLYHCPDLEAAAAELRRVVRPGGVLVASTNSTVHLQELRAEWTASLGEALGHEVDPWRSAAERFTLESGADVLGTAFSDVQVQRAGNRLVVPDVEPLVDYVASTRDLSGTAVDDDEVWDGGLERLRARLTAVIDQDGAFVATIVKGLFVCR